MFLSCHGSSRGIRIEHSVGIGRCYHQTCHFGKLGDGKLDDFYIPCPLFTISTWIFHDLPSFGRFFGWISTVFSHIWKMLVAFLVSLGVSFHRISDLFVPCRRLPGQFGTTIEARSHCWRAHSLGVWGATSCVQCISQKFVWVVVSNIFYFHPYLGKWSILTNIFQMGWNHQLETSSAFFQLSSSLTLVFFP